MYFFEGTSLEDLIDDVMLLNHKLDNMERKLDRMDEKMRKQVGTPLKKAEVLIKKEKVIQKAGQSLVKKAEKNNAKLANYDEKVRDPIIAKAKKMNKKGCR